MEHVKNPETILIINTKDETKYKIYVSDLADGKVKFTSLRKADIGFVCKPEDNYFVNILKVDADFVNISNCRIVTECK
jgi:hypothetical protein